MIIDDLRESKLSQKEIAVKHNVAESGISRIAHQAGIQRRERRGRPASKVIAKVWETVDWSKRDYQIAEELGVSNAYVWQRRRLILKGSK